MVLTTKGGCVVRLKWRGTTLPLSVNILRAQPGEHDLVAPDEVNF